MPVPIRTEEEIRLMRESGQRLAQVHEALREILRPGISTAEINAYGDEMIRRLGGIPNFLGQDGYPASICISINDEVVHGIPDENRYLAEGDIVSLDAGMIWKGWHSDAARTWGIGKISDEARALIAATEQSFSEGMKMAAAGNHLGDISAAIGDYAESLGYGVVRELAGHGIGQALHEYPNVPNYRRKKRGTLLLPGMTFAIEPMITLGNPEIVINEENGWTVTTADGSLSAHYENTVLITEGEVELLTVL